MARQASPFSKIKIRLLIIVCVMIQVSCDLTITPTNIPKNSNVTLTLTVTEAKLFPIASNNSAYPDIVIGVPLGFTPNVSNFCTSSTAISGFTFNASSSTITISPSANRTSNYYFFLKMTTPSTTMQATFSFSINATQYTSNVYFTTNT